MEYLFILLASFIGVLFLMQLVFFEITRNKMSKENNMNWFLSLKKPFNYHRVGYMFFICFICYLISSPEPIFSMSWIIYFVLFLAMGIVSDAIVQYLILVYSKKRCQKDIENATLLKNELLEIAETMTMDESWIESPRQYDEEIILSKYVQPTDHVSFLSVDQGELAKNFKPLPEATFIIEPYSDITSVQNKFADMPVKVLKYTPSGQMPFKDEKMDVVMCQYSNYDKLEIQRVLKPGGYFVVNQNGTANLKEFLHIYMPFRMKGSWDAYACAGTLESIGMRIVEKIDDYGTLRFHIIQAIHSYFKKYSPDIADINKYQIFYLKALKEIKEKSFYEMTTHRFLVVAQKA